MTMTCDILRSFFSCTTETMKRERMCRVRLVFNEASNNNKKEGDTVDIDSVPYYSINEYVRSDTFTPRRTQMLCLSTFL